MTSKTGRLSLAAITHSIEEFLAYSSSAAKAEFAMELPGVAQDHSGISDTRG